MKKNWITSLILVAVGVTVHAAPQAPVCEYNLDLASLTPQEAYTMKLITRLSGAPLSTFDPRFRRAVEFIKAGDPMSAARIATDLPGFLKVRVRGFSIPFIEKAHRPTDALTDLQALIIGVVRDELDARLLLTGNFSYRGYDSLGLASVSRESNDHYVQFEERDLDFDRDLQRVSPQWTDVDYAAGALTTRAWAASHYNGDTNRRAVRLALDQFLCTPIESWKIRGLDDSFVRRDIPRAPGGNPAEYQNNCRNCHANMDAMGGAFAKLDFENNKFIFKADGVVAKMNNNPQVFPSGYVTTDDSWVNLLDKHPSIDFGWRDEFSGLGLPSFARTLANSKAFSRCMVQKVFQDVCGKSITMHAPAELQPLADDFEAKSYNLRYLFANIAIQRSCFEHSRGLNENLCANRADFDRGNGRRGRYCPY